MSRNDHDQPERLDLDAERRQLFDDAVQGRSIVMPKDWHNIGFDATRALTRELRAVAGDAKIVDHNMPHT